MTIGIFFLHFFTILKSVFNIYKFENLFYCSTSLWIFDVPYFKLQAKTSSRLTDMSTTLVSAAIVIGNKECSYGFSLKSRPLDILIEYRSNCPWRISETYPTCVLFTKDKVFHSFGHKSENKYEELLDDVEHEDWYFFERFLSRFTLQDVRKYILNEVW